MKKSEIKIFVELDEENIPEKIFWDADEKETSGLSEAKSVSLSIWDHREKNTMRIDLWTKEMPVNEMKRFYLDCIGGISQSLLNATGDEEMAKKITQLVEELSQKT